MKLDKKWLVKNVLLGFLIYGVLLNVSIIVIGLLSDMFYFTYLLIHGQETEWSYIFFLILLVVRIILEQRKDYKAERKYFKEITTHYAVLSIITYAPFALLLFGVLKNGPLSHITRHKEKVIIYDLVFRPLTNSPVLAIILDFLIVTIVTVVAHFLSYLIITKRFNHIFSFKNQEQ